MPVKVKQVESVLISVYKEKGEKESIKEFFLILRNYVFNKVVRIYILLRNIQEKGKRHGERDCR